MPLLFGNPDYSAPRAFWIAPSVDRLLEAGDHFENTMLKPEEREAEQKAPEDGTPVKFRRFPVPEYEAMKARLRIGVKGQLGANRNDDFRSLVKWQSVKEIARSTPVADLNSGGQPIKDLPPNVLLDLVRTLELPPVKPSHFRNGDVVLPPSVSTETASALFDIPYRAIAKGGPKWIQAGHYNEGYLHGAWDVGAVETRLTSPVYKHTIFRNGKTLSEASDVNGGRFPDPDADGGDCQIGFAWGDAGVAILRAVHGPTSPLPATGDRLFHYFSKDRLPAPKAKVARTREAFSEAGFIKAEMFRFDLDSDGVTDILLWEGTGTSRQEIHDPGTPQTYYRIVFFNLGGEWQVFLADEFNYGCGC